MIWFAPRKYQSASFALHRINVLSIKHFRLREAEPEGLYDSESDCRVFTVARVYGRFIARISAWIRGSFAMSRYFGAYLRFVTRGSRTA